MHIKTIFSWLLVYYNQICWLFSEAFSPHPILYFDATDISLLRHKAKTSHLKIAATIQNAGKSLIEDPNHYLPPKSFEQFGSTWNEIYGNNLCAFAMYCVLYPKDEKALELVKLYMDRLTSYPSWYVTSSPLDQVPVGHSLTGFATAFDFLYDSFTENEKNRYLAKIRNVTAHMNEWIKSATWGWTKEHIHNHAPTNVLATLLGVLVCKIHFPEEALPWEKTVVGLLDKAMFLFSYIIDGSSDEGVAYGSYTSRGITQCIYLALRHFGKDHTTNPWVKEHFWFFFATTLPGYRRTVGIADSNYNWFYGPESQLVFLDSFVMRNGYGNWLADKIREKRAIDPPLAASTSHMWSSVHTEFIFYNASIQPIKPVLPSNSSLHVFSDWGVVTYGGGQDFQNGNTFLSFKSGAVHGEAVADIVDYKLHSSFINGWSSFNAGHEHPDQNSFVFAPNGQNFITEAFYSIKLTYLNNALTFSPVESKCNRPWEGQAGECDKWLAYSKTSPVPRGRIVTASSTTSGMVYIAADAVNAYRFELGLQSVQRSLLLLHPEVLLVLDTVVLEEHSKLQQSSVYFHNIFHQFHPYYHKNCHGAQIVHSDGSYSFFWFQPDGKSPNANFQTETLSTEAKPRTTNFINITFNLNSNQPSRIAYVFMGPNLRVTNVKFLPETTPDLSRIQIAIDNKIYKVSIVTLTASLSKRIKLIGFGGYALVRTDSKTFRLGFSKTSNVVNRWTARNYSNTQKFVQSLITSSDLSSPTSTDLNSSTLAPVQKGHDTHFCSSFFFICLLHLCLVFIWSLMKYIYQQKVKTIRNLIPLFVVVLMFGYFTSWSTLLHRETHRYLIDHSKNRESTSHTDVFVPPTVVIVALPQSGSELLQCMFENATDFLFLPFKHTTIPTGEKYNSKVYDPCYWPRSSHFLTTLGWFKTLSVEPLLFLNNHPTNPSVEKVRRKFRKAGKTGRFVLEFSSGFWNNKLPWLHNAIGNSMRTIVVVRDPRSWIYSLVRKDLPSEAKSRQSQLKFELIDNITCASPAILPFEFRNFKGRSTVEKLAEIWNANIVTMIRNSRQQQIVRFEDLITNPEYAATSIMQRLQTTIAVPEINRITRAVRSPNFVLPYELEVFSLTESVHRWKKNLSAEDINTIEEICHKMMKTLQYL